MQQVPVPARPRQLPAPRCLLAAGKKPSVFPDFVALLRRLSVKTQRCACLPDSGAISLAPAIAAAAAAAAWQHVSAARRRRPYI